MPIQYVPLQLVKLIHASQIRLYGGRLGTRDPGLFESALAQPKMSAGGRPIYKTIFDKASAYGFHLCKNHPFVDGNKRVAFVVMYIFMYHNGFTIESTEEEAYTMMIQLADGKLSKQKLSTWLKEHSKKL